MPALQPVALPTGSRIAEYEVVRILGAGGFGITYLAFDHQLDGPVALKEYFPADVATRVDGTAVEPASDASRETFSWGFDRFMHEARAIHRFRHPNVVQAHRYLEANGTAYIVMEYVEGESLKLILDRRGKLSAEEWRPWLDALVDCLAHVHGHGYLHRDLKPANIVVRAEDGEPVLIDFGSARVEQRDRTHTQVLTAGYAPIEQWSTDAAQGPPADIYALAAVSYRVLTGDPPPSAPDRVLRDDCEPLADRVPDADSGWLAALDRGLALKPEDRPRDVNEWSVALSTPSASDANSRAPERRRRTVEDGELLDDRFRINLFGKLAPRRLGIVTRLQRIFTWSLSTLQFWVGYAFSLSAKSTIAETWFRMAADLGDSESQMCLGFLYVDGKFHWRISWPQLSDDEKDPDPARAAKWFKKSAAQGAVDAQAILAMMYFAGIGVQQDRTKAERWCSRAAECGEPKAQNVLGVVRATGGDTAEAEKWFTKAALPGRLPGLWRRRHSGYAPAQFNLGFLYATDKRKRDESTAAKWLRKAAEQDLSHAQNAFGVMHATGKGVPQDDAEAERWFTEARKYGHSVARYNQAAMYVERGDDFGAVHDIRFIAEESDPLAPLAQPLAQSALGFLHAEGRGTWSSKQYKDDRSYLMFGREDDLDKAESYYRKAVESFSALHERRPRGGIPVQDPNWRIPLLDDWDFAYLHSRRSEPEQSGPLTWFLRGAERGHAAAQHSLARLHRHGWGVSTNKSESLTWLRLSAKQGYAEAQADLGEMYETGDGVPQDYGEALKWYRRAAKRGHARAMRLEGRLYETGEGVPVDKVAATRSYRRAAERGDDSAAADLRRMSSEGWEEPHYLGDGVQWVDWMRRAAEAGHATAQCALGNYFTRRPFGGPQDRAKALVWYRKAAEQGCVEGQVNLADMYTSDMYMHKHMYKLKSEDWAEAAKWRRKAAEQEDADAQYNLGWMYESGKGLPKDGFEAVKWYDRAARQGHSQAQRTIE